MTGHLHHHALAPRWQRRLVTGAWCAAAIAGALGLVRVAVGWVYPVVSDSMSPTLVRGEWVFLRWDRGRPDRFDLRAFRSESGEAMVKRVWALANERVLIEPAGDVRIDGELVRAEGRPGLVTVYDSRVLPLEGHWNHGGSQVDPWRRVEGDGRDEVWEVDAREVAPRLAASMMRHHKGVHDDRLLPDGTVGYGTVTVHDLELSVDVFIAAVTPSCSLPEVPRVRAELVEQGDRIEFSLDLVGDDGQAVGRIGRRRPEGAAEHATASFRVPREEWVRVTFRNVDDELSLTVGDQPPLVHRYAQNTPHRDDHDRDGAVDAPVEVYGERALFGADLACVRFRSLVLRRDTHVPAAGVHGVGRELVVGADEVYVLGDDPMHSRDSRDFGPVHVDRLIGRPTCVVWPPSAWRRLEP